MDVVAGWRRDEADALRRVVAICDIVFNLAAKRHTALITLSALRPVCVRSSVNDDAEAARRHLLTYKSTFWTHESDASREQAKKKRRAEMRPPGRRGRSALRREDTPGAPVRVVISSGKLCFRLGAEAPCVTADFIGRTARWVLALINPVVLEIL